jgi:uncharacterized caspase-like protein
MAEFALALLLVLIVALMFVPKAQEKEATAEATRGAPAERRVALVVGNAAYENSPLANPVNDAVAVGGALARLGFDVIEKHDLTAAQMRDALRDFEDVAAGADWALVYFSGHGMELGGRNYLVPVGARLSRATDAGDEAIPVERVLDRLYEAKKLRIVILDACRVNPYMARMTIGKGVTRAVPRGLAPIDPAHGEVLFYAARAGSIALDGGPGGNSPFAAALVKHMNEDGMELGRFFRKVTSSVLESTANRQEPFVYGRIPDEDFYFRLPRGLGQPVEASG